MFGYRDRHPGATTCRFDRRDSAAGMPKCQRRRSGLHLGRRPPAARTPWNERIIYELHVRGFTQLHPEVPAGAARHLRGPRHARRSSTTCALGVTAVELMPVHAFVDDRHLVERGLRNYWGYNTHRLLRPRHALLGDAGPR